MEQVKIAPSMLCADFRRLEEEVAALSAAGVDWLHFDCMDGQFVDNLTYGPLVLEALREGCELYFDAHLMMLNPGRHLRAFANAGADGICIHRETVSGPAGLLDKIKGMGCQAGLAFNPATPLEGLEAIIEYCDYVLLMSVEPGYAGQRFMPGVLKRIEQVRKLIDRAGLDTLIQVDGGITAETARQVIAAGANVLVSGSFFFGHPEGYRAAAEALRGAAQ